MLQIQESEKIVNIKRGSPRELITNAAAAADSGTSSAAQGTIVYTLSQSSILDRAKDFVEDR
jgi:hypothetical protein